MSVIKATKEIVEQTGKDVKDFMETFAKTYITELIKGKIDGVIDDAVNKVIPPEVMNVYNKLQGNDEEEEEVEDKKEGEGEEEKAIASGVHCISYRSGVGPDRKDHYFFDIACWSIKPKGSIIARVTQRHSSLIDHVKVLKKKSSKYTS